MGLNFVEVICQYGIRVQFRVQNREGNTQQLYAIASQFSQNEAIPLSFCIATHAVQAALSVEAPQLIIFSAVTDASVLKLCSGYWKWRYDRSSTIY